MVLCEEAFFFLLEKYPCLHRHLNMQSMPLVSQWFLTRKTKKKEQYSVICLLTVRLLSGHLGVTWTLIYSTCIKTDWHTAFCIKMMLPWPPGNSQEANKTVQMRVVHVFKNHQPHKLHLSLPTPPPPLSAQHVCVPACWFTNPVPLNPSDLHSVPFLPVNHSCLEWQMPPQIFSQKRRKQLQAS